MAPDARPYDAVLLLSFGGPEKADDVVPFLENVTRGRGIPRERLVEVGQHYFGFGGRSPINDQNREFLAALRADFDAHGIDLPLYWGNRNWDPYLTDTVAQMKADGVERAAVFTTSAYSSYSSCRQYRENLFDAVTAVEGAPRLDKLRGYFNHPGFVDPVVDGAVAAVRDLPEELQADCVLLAVTHSIPDQMNAASGPPSTPAAYLRQHRDLTEVVAARVRAVTGHDHAAELVFCSESGDGRLPWLRPDVNDRLTELAGAGTRAVVLIPLGFVSDHMEVVYDLDTEATATATDLGLEIRRSATAGTDPRFVATVRDLLLERAAVERGGSVERARVGTLDPLPDLCPVGCCAGRVDRPALCGAKAPA